MVIQLTSLLNCLTALLEYLNLEGAACLARVKRLQPLSTHKLLIDAQLLHLALQLGGTMPPTQDVVKC